VQDELKTERLDARSEEDLARAAHLLRHGGTVAFPTETVYGLGANALDPQAVARIFAAKQRPSWDPLIVHIADPAALPELVSLNRESSARVDQLSERFWPGPLTLLLPRTPAVPDAVTAGRSLVGIRMPAHPVAQSLIELAGIPVAAPSANRFGHTSPTTAAHVLADLDGRIDAVLDGGSCTVGVESTVLDPAQWPMVLYRQGAVTAERLEQLCGPGSVRVFLPEPSAADPQSLPSPGVGLRHYAPKARLILIQNPEETREIFDLLADQYWQQQGSVGVMLPEDWPSPSHAIAFRWGPWRDKERLAHRLFQGLRELDERGATVILCPLPSPEGLGAAIRDRLEKAARTE
jgi:L-threonylcarbamoyladenylate synthase